MTVSRLVGRRHTRLTANPRGAIYGTIVATALIAATGSHADTVGQVVLTVVVTMLVFWLAHVYAEVLVHGHYTVAAVRRAMADELAMVEAPALSVVLLLFGAAGLLDRQMSINLALANGILQLFLWGVASARRLGRRWPAALLVGLVDSALGAVIVILEALLH